MFPLVQSSSYITDRVSSGKGYTVTLNKFSRFNVKIIAYLYFF